MAWCTALVLVSVRPAHAQSTGGGARALDAPDPPGAPPAPPRQGEPERAAVPPVPPPIDPDPPVDPRPRLGLAGIVVGWSGLGASIASLAMMATCDPLFTRARQAIDTDQSPDVAEDVDMAVHEGTRICRAVYGAFAGAAGSLAVLGLPIGYGRRHRHQERLERGVASGRGPRLSLQPSLSPQGGGLILRGIFR